MDLSWTVSGPVYQPGLLAVFKLGDPTAGSEGSNS